MRRFCWTVTAAIVGIVAVSTGADALAKPTGKTAPKFRRVSTVKELLYACKKASGGGYTIQILPGTYEIDNTIHFKDVNSVNIAGSGWNTVILRKGSGDAIRFERTGFCTVKDIIVQGYQSAKSGSGIVFSGPSSSNTVDFCRIVNFPEHGISYIGDPKSPSSSNTVSRCHFIGNLQDQLHSSNNNDFYILQNQFGTHGGTPMVGCRLDHSSAGTYGMNYHWGNVNALVAGPGSHYNRIENNRFEECGETALIIGDLSGKEGSCYNIVTGNTIHTNSSKGKGIFPAVVGYASAAITFTNNQVFSWDSNTSLHKNSLVVNDSCDRWIIKDNIFRHNSEKALVYSENGRHIVKDNIMD